MSFPGAIPTFIGFTALHTLAADSHASQHNLEQSEIVAIATKVGTGASTPTDNKVLRGNGTGTSQWAQVNLANDVTGVLPINNGGNGTNSTTGTGSAVFSTAPTISAPTITSGGSWTGSPTLSTPTIVDFTNAQHDHGDADDGGPLASQSVTFSMLLSTIFSGQVSNTTGGGVGSFFYINLGGLKLFWGATTGTASGGTTSITLPASFFSTIQSVTTSPGPVSGTNSVEDYINSASTSTIIVGITATAGSGTMPVQLLVIGS